MPWTSLPNEKTEESLDRLFVPPCSIKWEGKSNPLNINDSRFSPAGVLAPPSKADLAFTMHMLSWLSTEGTAAIVEFPGVLYRGGAEAKIRTYLVQNNFVDAVIQLPADLFFGTTIATCALVLKKSKADSDILFVDASNEFMRSDAKNKLAQTNINRIADAVFSRSEEEHFSKIVSNDDVLANDANLSVSSYVEKEDTREEIDIRSLNAEIARIVAREQELREQIDAIVADLEGDE
ncbi:type I restriction-modification system subunit M [Xiamenia xianingshaonis]|uniref:type I restriction-modification system subunit M n=1 Tax=Xiamenia xianingshaonis TaxID=2682776 RepID=UPI0021BDBD3E|nr:type I restriction-modification system subunit M [Xiamenia xianingshaonis]